MLAWAPLSLEKNSSHSSLVKKMSQTVWFVDYDGSICPHLEVWEERNYDPEDIYLTLKRLESKGAEMLWNTGRRVESLAGVSSKFLEFSGYFIHGSVFWNHQTKIETLIVKGLDQDHAKKLAGLIAGQDDFKIEIKATAIRIAPKNLERGKDLARWLFKVLENDWVTPPGWIWHKSPRGWDLLFENTHKGSALAGALAERPNKIPVVVGDDTLDRFAAKEALARGGFAILVGDNCGWIADIPHSPQKVVFFEQPSDFLDFLKNC